MDWFKWPRKPKHQTPNATIEEIDLSMKVDTFPENPAFIINSPTDQGPSQPPYRLGGFVEVMPAIRWWQVWRWHLISKREVQLATHRKAPKEYFKRVFGDPCEEETND